MKEEVIVLTLRITRRKEQRYFQLRLPADTERIIGVETGLLAESALPYYPDYESRTNWIITRNRLMGRLQLQAPGKSNVFYSKEIFDQDSNALIGEIITREPVPKDIFPPPLKPGAILFPLFQQGSHGIKREEDPLNICGCTVISGQYKDALGNLYNQDIIYTIMLYIWIEKKQQHDN